MPFLVDNATGLYDRPLKNNENTFEAISFHQTKLWGIGEGGCIICPAKYHDQLINFINFGAKNFNLNKKYSSNYKIPDINCALILQRLHFLSVNERFNFAMQKRIKKIIFRNNFDLCKFEVNKNSNSPQTYTPYTSSKIIKLSDLNKTKFIQLRKYYKPLIGLKNSNKIYQNIVCIPNNPDLMNLTDNQIEDDLNLILN